MVDEGQEKTKKEKILELIAKGYRRSQLINDLDFAERTVDEAIKEYRERYGELPSEATVSVREGRHELMKIGQKDMVAPESIVETLILPQDGKTAVVWKDGYLSCLYQVFGVARLLQVLSAGQADIVTSQLQLWREARESNKDIAVEAAHAAVSQAIGYIDQKLPKGPPPKDTSELITRRIDKMWDMMEHMMEQRLMPGYAANQPPEGWEYERKPVMTAQGAAQGTPGGWETEQRKENTDVQSSDVRGESPADAAGEGGGTAPQDGDNQAPPAGAA